MAFPISIAGSASRERARSSAFWQKRFLIFSIVTLVILSASILRRPGILWPTLYFEDGSTFYRDQLLTPSLRLLIEPYAGGYALPVPRLIALLASFVSPLYAPYVFNGLGILICSVCTAVFCLPRFRLVLRSDWSRIVLCFLFGLSLDNTEALTSASNCFWAVGLAVLLFAAVPPAALNRPRQILSFFASALLAYSTPLSLIAVPLASFVSVRARKNRRLPWYLGMLLGAAVALAIHLNMHLQIKRQDFESTVVALVVSITHRVILSPIAGYLPSMNHRDDLLRPLMALMGFTGLLSLLILKGGSSIRIRSLWGLYVILAASAQSIIGRNFIPDFQQMAGPSVLYGGPRYFYLPCCAFAFLVALAAERHVPVFLSKIRLRHSAVGSLDLLSALVVVLIFVNGFYANFSSVNGKHFSWHIYAAQIEQWTRQRDLWQHKDKTLIVSPVAVPINLPDWRIVLPGNRLSDGGFENQISSWQPFGIVQQPQSVTVAHSGQHSILLHGKDGGIYTDLSYLQPGTHIEISGFAKGDPGESGEAILWVIADDKAFTDGPTHLSSSEWRRLSVLLTVLPSRSIRIHLMVKPGVAYWDDVSVRPCK